MRRRWLRATAGAGAGVAVVGVAALAALGLGGVSAGEPATSDLPPGTATVERTTLVHTERLSGTLGYGAPTTVTAGGGGDGDPGTGGSGTVTGLPAAGGTVGRGDELYQVDAEPVVLLYGKMPFYRPLGPGDRGDDVAQLESNLAKLGYDGFTADDEYTWATAEAVRQWQEDLGWEQTGRLEPSRVVVAPGRVRVAEHLVTPGAPASGPVLTYTAVDRSVTVDLDVADRELVAVDMPATVRLPGGQAIDATVTSVGSVAVADDDGGPGNGGSATVEVVVEVADQEALGDYDTAPVEVTVEADRREDVLAVPVGALVALAEGGYGVQVVEEGGTSYLPVEVGMFAGGRVEVTGDGLTEGTTVGVPA